MKTGISCPRTKNQLQHTRKIWHLFLTPLRKTKKTLRVTGGQPAGLPLFFVTSPLVRFLGFFFFFFFCLRPYLFESLRLGFSVFLLFFFLVPGSASSSYCFLLFSLFFLHLLLIIHFIIMFHILLLLTTIHLHLLCLYLLILPILLLMLLLTHKPTSKRKQTGKTDRFDD